jgi:lysozyme family protein
MSIFELSIPTILRHEGGFVDDPNDAGGATRYGISLRWLRTIWPSATIDSIRNLTVGDASQLYLVHWWNQYGYGRVLDQSIATKIFDTAVNMGPVPAHKIVQEAAGATADGILGLESITAINAQQASALLPRMRDLQAARYREIAIERPQDAKFLNDWLDRAFDRN